MRPKREIRLGHLVTDIRSGLTDSDLRAKYKLSSRGLQSAFKKLADSGAIRAFGTEHVTDSQEYWAVIDNMRQSPRLRPHFVIPIIDGEDRKNRGIVRDITIRGIGTAQVRARPQEIKTLIIPHDELGEYGSFSFEAQCRWCEAMQDGNYMAGFEITNISQGCFNELQCLIRVYTL